MGASGRMVAVTSTVAATRQEATMMRRMRIAPPIDTNCSNNTGFASAIGYGMGS